MKKYKKDKDDRIIIRMSHDEKERVKAFAKFIGFNSLSDYIRFLIKLDQQKYRDH